MLGRKSETEEERQVFAKSAYRFTGYLMCILNIAIRVLTAIKEVAFAKALVSIFTMQVAMLTKFGGEPQTSFIFNLLTGIAVIIGVTVLTSIMLRKGLRDKKCE